jgi:hypothetical protein
MKSKLLAAIIISTTVACTQTEKNSTNNTTPKSDTAKTALAGTSTNNVGATNATNAIIGLPGPNKTGVNIDKNPEIIVNGSQISTIEFIDDQGADVTEKYFIQKDANEITLTVIQALRGAVKGLNKSVYLINANDLNKKSIEIEEINNKKYANGKYYAVNIQCITGKNCMGHTYEDIGVGNAIDRVETLTQVSFVEKTTAENFMALLKASL